MLENIDGIQELISLIVKILNELRKEFDLTQATELKLKMI